MSRKELWDFECPQYVDFERELDKSKEDEFFDCRGVGPSPDNENLCKTPGLQDREKGLTESDENKLLDKMTSALSFLENTPKIKKSAVKGKILSAKFSSNSTVKTAESTLKSKAVPASHAKLRRSKSLDQLDKIISGKSSKVKECGLRKSSSLDDLKTQRKLKYPARRLKYPDKSKYPITPMCLKRTIVKAKEKIYKTSEERELEKIATLQKQLILHLRQNEISLRKLKLQPRPCVIPKTVRKTENFKKNQELYKYSREVRKEDFDPQEGCSTAIKQMDKDGDYTKTEKHAKLATKDLQMFTEKLNIIEKDSRPNIFKLNPTVVKSGASKLDGTNNNHIIPSKKPNIYNKPKNPFICSVDSDSDKTAIGTKKQAHNRLRDHSGLLFIPSVKNNISARSFIFEPKIQESKTQAAGTKQKEKFVLNLNENNDKENVPRVRSLSVSTKIHGIQNTKCDNSKLMESNKMIGKKTANALRGKPLAENLTRN